MASAYHVLPVDAPAFRVWAQQMRRSSDTISEDPMIAATAKVHGLTVVTRSVVDFRSFGMPLFSPFKA